MCKIKLQEKFRHITDTPVIINQKTIANLQFFRFLKKLYCGPIFLNFFFIVDKETLPETFMSLNCLSRP